MGRCRENLKFKVTPYETRQKGSFYVPIFKIGYGSRSIKVKGAQLWNNIHGNIKKHRSTLCLKKGLYEYYISLYIDIQTVYYTFM